MAVVRDTIFDVLQILRQNLENALNALPEVMAGDAAIDNVVVGNIAFAENGVGRLPSLTDRIVLTMVKMEEEFTLKNQPNNRRNPVTGALEYVNPPVFLNLYVLVTANNQNYEKAILFLSRVIGFFQYKSVFTEQNSSLPASVPLTRFSFNTSMVSLTFEQINHLWGVLGGKQLPSVLYKVQLLEIQYEDETKPGEIIREIVLGEKIY